MKRTVLFFTAGILAGGLILCLVQHFFCSGGDTTRYVSMSLVFEECHIRDKYKQELKTLEQQSNAQLAGMENELRTLKASGGDAALVAKTEQELLAQRDQLSAAYQQKSETFERVIWEKINQKVGEYGKEKGYDYIFGAKGDGAIMYASDARDITKEVIAYINK